MQIDVSIFPNRLRDIRERQDDPRIREIPAYGSWDPTQGGGCLSYRNQRASSILPENHFEFINRRMAVRGIALGIRNDAELTPSIKARSQPLHTGRLVDERKNSVPELRVFRMQKWWIPGEGN